MKFDIKRVIALVAGLALYIALPANLSSNRDVVDCLVLAELLSRIVTTRQV